MAKRTQPKRRHYRCKRCRSPIPSSYKTCGVCGYGLAAADELFERALIMFPGSREVK